jgi:hypothetical protein
MRCRCGGRLRLVLVGAALALGTVGAGGCTSARNTLGTNSSPCFRALALAADAVHDRGTFAGVRLAPASTLAKFHHLNLVLTERSTTPLHNVCLVSYRGMFRLSEVSKPAGRVPPSGQGHFAIVVVSTPQNRLLATFVLERQPLRFEHMAIGPVPGSPGAAGHSGVD